MWFKVDDTFVNHPKVRVAAGHLGEKFVGRVVAVWLEAGLYASRYSTDGYVPVSIVESTFITDRKPIEVLEACRKAGLVTQENGGYFFHDWHDYQPVAAARKAHETLLAKKKQIHQIPELADQVRARDGGRCRYCGRLVNWKDRRGDLAGTYDFADRKAPVTLDNTVVCCRRCEQRKAEVTSGDLQLKLLAPGTTEDQLQSQLVPNSYLVESQMEASFEARSDLVGIKPIARAHTRAIPSRPVPSQFEKPEEPRRARRARPVRMSLELFEVRPHLTAAVHALIECGSPFVDAAGAPELSTLCKEIGRVAGRDFGVVVPNEREITAIVDAALRRRAAREKQQRIVDGRDRRELRKLGRLV